MYQHFQKNHMINQSAIKKVDSHLKIEVGLATEYSLKGIKI